MEPIEDEGELLFQRTQLYTKEKIMASTAGHVITHLKIDGDVPSTIEEFAPHVTNLCIQRINDPRSLD